MRKLKILGTIALWAVQVLAALAFFVAGTAKFGDPSWARNFARWGYPDGFYLVIGVAETLGAFCLLVPRIASYAAAVLGAIMVGAALTHVVQGQSQFANMPVIYLGLLLVVGVGRFRSVARLRRSSPSGVTSPAR